MILALDLASVCGWAVGDPGKLLAHGSLRFARQGSSHEAIFAKAHVWLDDKIETFRPTTVVWEAPLPASFKRGKTNVDTTTLLYGLPAVIGALTYLRRIYDIRKAATRDVRLHFIGQNPKGAKAKPMVIRQCRAMGWDVKDDNEADACATWHYMCSLIRPELAIRPTPLFGQTIKRGLR